MHPRRRTFLAGRVMMNKLSTFDCVVKNMSDGGALLALDSTVGVPDRFELLLKASSEVRHCGVAWRTPERIGVQFLR